MRGFTALDQEMLVEVIVMLAVRVEVMRGQHGREDRHFGLQLHLHQRRDDRLRHEVMTVDAAIDHQAAGDDAGILAGLGQHLGVQGDFEGTGQFEEIDAGGGPAQLGHFLGEGDAALVDDVLVPAGLDEGDTLTVVGRDGRQMRLMRLRHGSGLLFDE